MTAYGRVHQVNSSPGGVPKLPVTGTAEIGVLGLRGDGHDYVHHGGPDRALCLFSLEVIETLRAEGHPIEAGSTGENLTIAGLEWAALASGDRLEIGPGVVAELTWPAAPCAKNAGWFTDRDFRHIDETLHPGRARWYARVLVEGEVRAGDQVTHRPMRRSPSLRAG